MLFQHEFATLDFLMGYLLCIMYYPLSIIKTMPVYHTTLESTAGHITLLEQHQAGFCPDKTLTPSSGSQWFPDISSWDVQELEIMSGNITSNLASKWSVENTIRFYRNIERYLDKKRMWRRRNTTDNGQDHENENVLDLGVGLHVLIESANSTFGINNWISMVNDSIITTYEPNPQDESKLDKLVIKSKVRLILGDNTTIEKFGFGYAHNLNKFLAFRKAKKESVTNAMKQCFAGLIVLLFKYEDGVKSGFYEKYTTNKYIIN